jgi:sucrose phosphorylase
MLALEGLPGIYLPSLFGAANWHEGVAQTARARSINREKFDLATLVAILHTPGSRYGQVFRRYRELLRHRARCSAFYSEAPQSVLKLHPALFALQRGAMVALHNVSDGAVEVTLPDDVSRRDLLSDTHCRGSVVLQPYQVMWLDSEG